VRVVLELGATIRGTVLDASGNPFPAGTISLKFTNGYLESSRARTKTDESGNYATFGLRAGTYEVVFPKGGSHDQIGSDRSHGHRGVHRRSQSLIDRSHFTHDTNTRPRGSIHWARFTGSWNGKTGSAARTVLSAESPRGYRCTAVSQVSQVSQKD